jgi:SAM-dependent methyltransferase
MGMIINISGCIRAFKVHPNAMHHAGLFFRTYVPADSSLDILEIGALDVNGSPRTLAPPRCNYVGADFAEGKGVDVILTDAYSLPFADETFDVCISSSCFEHAEFFWLSFNEALRVLKPDGLFYLNVPSNGGFHRFPVDCWRFYPDAARALENWGRRSGYNCAALESFTGIQLLDSWNDFVSVFIRDTSFIERHPSRIIESYKRFRNGMTYGSDKILNLEYQMEDIRTPKLLRKLKRRFRRLVTSIPS